MGAKWIDLTGSKFGSLTVLKEVGKTKNNMKLWECECSCGNRVVVPTNNLKSGHTKSCGCAWKNSITKHGKCDTRLYSIWRNMKQRCYNCKNKAFNNYGGRGISVSNEWKESFERFYEWSISHGYSKDLQLDRVDNNGNYEPENCRWVTRTENNRNKRTNHFITFNEETHTLKEWGELKGINYQVILWRLKKGWSLEDALTKVPSD